MKSYVMFTNPIETRGQKKMNFLLTPYSIVAPEKLYEILE